MDTPDGHSKSPRDADEDGRPTIPAPISEAPGDDIGPYHLIDVVGEGGFGVVYLAERRAPMVQRVALKVIKPGMDSRAVIARFEQERQALAMLDHPNIAKVFDAGATKSGRPYFVMELVRGKPVTQYATDHNLDLHQRLGLLVTIARAVDHANQGGLVHRDLKPTNILVAEHDGQPVPKVIDFGVVKALRATLTDKTVHTAPNQAIGTPGYMSPEQADPSASEVDARSDVYSLGILMFELLTGQLPYDLAKLRSVSPSQLPTLLAVLQPKRAGDINPALRGDLDTIIRTAMHPDCTRRYQSAHDLAEEIERHLRGEPIHARRDSMAYVVRTRVRTAARRAPLAVLLVAWVLALVLNFNVAEPLLFKWTTLGGRYGPLLNMAAGPLTPQPTMEQTRVVALTDDHAPEELGTLARVEGVSSADLYSMRLIDGELLKRLAGAQPAVVVIDICFSSDSEFDNGLGSGIQALNAAHVPWVASVSTFALGDQKLALARIVSSDAAASYGCGSFTFGDGFSFFNAVARRGSGRPDPSLAVLAYALNRRPGARSDVALHDERCSLDLSYWAPDPATPAAHPPTGTPDTIQLTSVQPNGTANPTLALLADDIVGLFQVAIPSDQVLDDHTADAADVLRADAQTLCTTYSGKVVVLGDMRAEMADLHRLPEGRVVGGPQLVAAAIDEMIAGRATVTPDAFDKFLIVGVPGLVGAVIGHIWRARVGKWWMILILASIVLLALCVASYAAAGFLCNPTAPLLTMLVASCAALIGSRVLLDSDSQRRTSDA